MGSLLFMNGIEFQTFKKQNKDFTNNLYVKSWLNLQLRKLYRVGLPDQ